MLDISEVTIYDTTYDLICFDKLTTPNDIKELNQMFPEASHSFWLCSQINNPCPQLWITERTHEMPEYKLELGQYAVIDPHGDVTTLTHDEVTMSE
jgi:hypothetical protein